MAAKCEGDRLEESRVFIADGLGLPAFPQQMISEGEDLGFHIMGATVVAWLSEHPLRRWQNSWLRGGTISLRFRRRLEAGDVLTMVVSESRDEQRFELWSDDGALCADGRATCGEPPVLPSPVLESPPLPEPPLDPRSDVLVGADLGSVELVFDSGRDLAFVKNLAPDDPWRNLTFAHPAWLVTAANGLIRRAIGFPLGRFIHAGVNVTSLAPIESGSTLVVRGQVVEQFATEVRRFAVVRVIVASDRSPSAILDLTIAY